MPILAWTSVFLLIDRNPRFLSGIFFLHPKKSFDIHFSAGLQATNLARLLFI
jgi:hypothetical protein